MKRLLCIALLGMGGLRAVCSEPLLVKYADRLTLPKSYVCFRCEDSIRIDGVMDEESWKRAPYTDFFVDIRGEQWPSPRQATRAKLLWDDNYLYIYAELEEAHIWSNITERDAIIYHDNDFEVFIDPQGNGHNYFEIEVNARGVGFDLSLTSAYRNPRRPFIQFQWNCPGLKLATHHNGTLNNPADIDKGWRVEMAIPKEAIATEFDNFLQEGNYLRINFSRVQWQHEVINGRYERKIGKDGKLLPEDNWVWSPTGEIAMHMPERWGYVFLSGEKGESEMKIPFIYPDDEAVRRFLWMLFYALEDYYAERKTYCKTIDELGLTEEDWKLLPEGYHIQFEPSSIGYLISACSEQGKMYVIDQSGYCAEVTK